MTHFSWLRLQCWPPFCDASLTFSRGLRREWTEQQQGIVSRVCCWLQSKASIPFVCVSAFCIQAELLGGSRNNERLRKMAAANHNSGTWIMLRDTELGHALLPFRYEQFLHCTRVYTSMPIKEGSCYASAWSVESSMLCENPAMQVHCSDTKLSMQEATVLSGPS